MSHWLAVQWIRSRRRVYRRLGSALAISAGLAYLTGVALGLRGSTLSAPAWTTGDVEWHQEVGVDRLRLAQRDDFRWRLGAVAKPSRVERSGLPRWSTIIRRPRHLEEVAGGWPFRTVVARIRVAEFSELPRVSQTLYWDSERGVVHLADAQGAWPRFVRSNVAYVQQDGSLVPRPFFDGVRATLPKASSPEEALALETERGPDPGTSPLIQLIDPARRALFEVFNGPVKVDGGVTVRVGNGVLLVPLAPYWTGLVMSTAAFTGAYLILIYGRRCAAVVKRFRSGACMKCGYSLEGLAASHCPECGSKLTQA